jgi:hypothetical protein
MFKRPPREGKRMTTSKPGELKVVDVHSRSLSGLKEEDVIFAYLENLDLLQECIEAVRGAMAAAGVRRGAIVLPIETRLYKLQSILESAAANAVFGIVPTREEWSQMSTEDIVRSRFAATDLDNLGTSWTEDLEEFKRRLPDAKGFGTDPALYEYFR